MWLRCAWQGCRGIPAITTVNCRRRLLLHGASHRVQTSWTVRMIRLRVVRRSRCVARVCLVARRQVENAAGHIGKAAIAGETGTWPS